MLRGVLFDRIALGNAAFQQSHSRSSSSEPAAAGFPRRLGNMPARVKTLVSV
jgi:hypothetical protein